MQAQKAQLARQASSSPLKPSSAGEEGFSAFRPGMSDGQSSLLCSPVCESSLEEFPQCSPLPGDLGHTVCPSLCHKNHLRAGSSLAARCCIQSKISQGIKSKAQSDNLQISTAQLSLARDSNHHFQQLLPWISAKPDTKSSLLKTRRIFICNTHKGLHAGGAPAGPAAASGILSSALTERSWLSTLGLQKQPCQDLLNLNI